MYAMDGLFGLPRKKSAGTSYRQPLLGSLYFCDQHAVDEYVANNHHVKAVKDVRYILDKLLIGVCNWVHVAACTHPK